MEKNYVVIKTTFTATHSFTDRAIHSEHYVNNVHSVESERHMYKNSFPESNARIVRKTDGYNVYKDVVTDGVNERWKVEVRIYPIEQVESEEVAELLNEVVTLTVDHTPLTIKAFRAYKVMLSYNSYNEIVELITLDGLSYVYSLVQVKNAQHSFTKKFNYQAPFNIEVDHLVSTQQVTLTLLNTDNNRLELLKIINTALTNNRVVHKVYSDKRKLFTIQLEFSLLSKALNVIDEAITKDTCLTLLHKTDVERIKLGDYIVDRNIVMFAK